MTKRELSQLYYLNREIDRECARLAQLEAAATSTTSTISGLPHAGTIADKTAIAAAIADSRAIIEAKVTAAVHEYNRLIRYISGIKDSLTRQIFELRYIDGLTWQQIAFEVGEHDETYVRRKHNYYLKLAENAESNAI